MKRLFTIFLINLFLTSLYPQSVDPDSIWINGNIPRMTTLRFIRKSGLKIDSIVRIPGIMNSLSADSLVYAGESFFSYYKKDTVCIANSIILDDKINKLKLGRHTITRATNRAELKGMFPVDCIETYPIKPFGNERFECCSIPVKDSLGRLWDMRIMFFFQSDRLVRIDFWEPD